MDVERLDICVVTYNRLEYLRRCVWSIIMSTKVPYRLFVLSDHSTDGTNDWLLDMQKHGKIDKVIINEENIGSANSFNKVINATDSDWFVMSCDDIYFYRGWDKAAIRIMKELRDCGIVSIGEYTRNGKNVEINDHTYYRQNTGLGGSVVYRELFDKIGGFNIPDGIKMGYFARVFCGRATKLGKGGEIRRWKQYLTKPEYATVMDWNEKYSQNYLYRDYNIRKGVEKNKFKQYYKK